MTGKDELTSIPEGLNTLSVRQSSEVGSYHPYGKENGFPEGEASDEGTYELQACFTEITGIERSQREKGRLELRRRKAEAVDGRLGERDT